MLGENARARLSYPVSLSPFCMSMCVQKRNRIHSSLVVPSDFFSVPARPLFLELRRIPRNFRTPSEHTSELNHSGARIICTGILRNPEFRPEFRREGPRTWYFVPHVTNIYYEDTKKKGVNDGILPSAAAATAPRRKPLRRAAVTAATA